MKEPSCAQPCNSSQPWCTERPEPPRCPPSPVGFPWDPLLAWPGKRRRPRAAVSLANSPPGLSPLGLLSHSSHPVLSALGKKKSPTPDTSSTSGGGVQRERCWAVDAGGGEADCLSGLQSQEERSSTRKNPLFCSPQGLLLEPEVAFRILWNPWINSSSTHILYTLYTTGHNNFCVTPRPDNYLEGKDCLALFLLETTV